MGYAYNIAIDFHVSSIVILMFGYGYAFYVVAIKSHKAMDRMIAFKGVLPFLYTMISIVLFSGLSLLSLGLALGADVVGTHFVYMVSSLLLVFIRTIKLFKKTKKVFPWAFNAQIDFETSVRKTVVFVLFLLLLGLLL